MNADGWGGIAVACFIIFSGFKAAKETLSPLLGNRRTHSSCMISPTSSLPFRGHGTCTTLIVHDHGPGRLMVSLHAEVPGNGNIYALHDTIDTIEYELSSKARLRRRYTYGPSSPDGTKTAHMRDEFTEAAKSIDPASAYTTSASWTAPTHTNVIFDAVLPNDSKLTEEEAVAQLETLVHSLWQNSHPKVHIDRPFG